MRINDLESHAANNEVKNDDIDKFIKSHGSSEVGSLSEAKEQLSQLFKFIKKLKANIDKLSKDLQITNEVRIDVEKKLSDSSLLC